MATSIYSARHDDANHAHCGRRPKASREGNRGKWQVVVPRALVRCRLLGE